MTVRAFFGVNEDLKIYHRSIKSFAVQKSAFIIPPVNKRYRSIV